LGCLTYRQGIRHSKKKTAKSVCTLKNHDSCNIVPTSPYAASKPLRETACMLWYSCSSSGSRKVLKGPTAVMHVDGVPAHTLPHRVLPVDLTCVLRQRDAVASFLRMTSSLGRSVKARGSAFHNTALGTVSSNSIRENVLACDYARRKSTMYDTPRTRPRTRHHPKPSFCTSRVFSA
jgi:hypothetical protein